MKHKKTEDIARINSDIKSSEVRVITAEGKLLGVLPIQDAIRKAQEAGLDLIEISPNASPPVCKIMDYGKYRYDNQKKMQLQRKKQKVVDLKEVKIKPNIDINDYNVKLRNARKFLNEGNKVKFSLRFRGREITHSEIGIDLINRVKEDLSDISTPQLEPKLEGMQILMILVPK